MFVASVRRSGASSNGSKVERVPLQGPLLNVTAGDDRRTARRVGIWLRGFRVFEDTTRDQHPLLLDRDLTRAEFSVRDYADAADRERLGPQLGQVPLAILLALWEKIEVGRLAHHAVLDGAVLILHRTALHDGDLVFRVLLKEGEKFVGPPPERV